MAKTKYYAVVAGKNPGIYETWADCQEQITGFPKPIYKSFKTLDEAKEYIKFGGKLPKSADKTSKEVDMYQLKDYTVIFTDGSFEASLDIASWAFADVTNPKAIVKYADIVKDRSLNVSRNIVGEVYAVIRSLQYCKKFQKNKVVIFHDYEGLGHWYKKTWQAKTKIAQQYIEALKMFEDMEILFHWVKGHSKNLYNDLVDKLAYDKILEYADLPRSND